MTLKDVAKATGGRILRGSPDTALAGISTDTKTVKPGELFFALHGERHDAHQFLHDALSAGAGAAVVHKKDAAEEVKALPMVLVADTTRALGDLARWHRKQFPTTVIGITGSNGKTTTKEMLHHILSGIVPSVSSRASFNNAVGVPLTLFQVRPQDVYAVVEMGTNSPGEIARLCEIADPDLGVLTNVGESHLEGLGSLEGIAREKSALIKHTCRRGGAFYNADNFWARRVAKSAKGTLWSFGAENDADYRMFNLRADTGGISFKIVGGPRIQMTVPGLHNAMNALAAIAVARRLGLDWNMVAERLATFKLPQMRMQTQVCCGVTLINDAYNANPASAEAAVRTLRMLECPGEKILVFADMLELGEHSARAHQALGKLVAGTGLGHVFGLGRHAAELLAAATKHGMSKGSLHLADSRKELAETLLPLVRPGDAILFKGSRDMRLEEVLRLVQEGLEAQARAGQEAQVLHTDCGVTGVPDKAPSATYADAETVAAEANGGVTK